MKQEILNQRAKSKKEEGERIIREKARRKREEDKIKQDEENKKQEEIKILLKKGVINCNNQCRT